MNIIQELARVCSQLEIGVIDGDRITTLLRDSEAEHKCDRLSLHRSTADGRCEIKDQLVIQLRRLSLLKNDNKRDEIAMQQAPRIRGLFQQFLEKYGSATEACIDDVIRRKFRRVWKSKGSQNERADSIDKQVTAEQWQEFSKSRGISRGKRAYFYKLILDCDGDRPPKWLGI